MDFDHNNSKRNKYRKPFGCTALVDDTRIIQRKYVKHISHGIIFKSGQCEWKPLTLEIYSWYDTLHLPAGCNIMASSLNDIVYGGPFIGNIFSCTVKSSSLLTLYTNEEQNR